MKPLLIHGTCVEIKQKAVLICGKPGAGKSSLALQLIDRGAILVADDQTMLTLENGHIIAQPPSSLKGLMEVRGIGICTFPYQEKSILGLCVEVSEGEILERLPDPAFQEYLGLQIPLLRLQKHDPLGGMKVELKVLKRALKEG
jgi:HPr kinase/phosphorylase